MSFEKEGPSDVVFCKCCCSKRQKCGMLSVAITGLVLSIIGGLLYLFYHLIFNAVVKEQTKIREGTLLYPEWVKPSQKVYVGFYLMNITNAEEFAAQKPGNFVKPIIEQKGPYTYRAYIEKDRIQPLDVFPKQISYRQTFPLYFEPELTVGSEDDWITTINFIPLALGPFFKYVLSSPEAENVTNIQKAAIYRTLNRLIEDANSTLITKYKAGEMLFGVRDPLLTSIIDVINVVLNQTSLSHLVPISDLFGLFLIPNSTAGWHHFNAYTGEPDYHLTNMITLYDNQTELDFWFDKTCNMINGTDGTTRPPFSRREDIIYHYFPNACRSTYVKYTKDVTVKGVPGWEYRPPPEMFKAPRSSEENKCFCEESDDSNYCIHDGGLYMAQCLFGAPLMISAPHFLHGDGFYLGKIIGMKPDYEEHTSSFVYEEHTGAAIMATKKLQFNLYVQPDENIKISQIMDEYWAFPIMWVNGTYTINDEDAELLFGLIVISEIVVIVVEILMFITGVGLLVYVSRYYVFVYKKEQEDSISPYSSKKESVYKFTNGAYNTYNADEDKKEML
ncbi:platelet glycoprotein 4-like [Styela clava]